MNLITMIGQFIGNMFRRGLGGTGSVSPTPSETPPAPPAHVPVSYPSPTPWMDLLKSWDGEHELTGEVMDAFEKMIFSHTSFPVNGIEPQSCAATASAALELAGYKSAHSAAAKDYLNYGLPLDAPKYGCLVVWPHHVTFYNQQHQPVDGHALLFGGNQNHKVCSEIFNLSGCVYRWPIQ